MYFKFNFPKNFLIKFFKKTVGNAEPSCINLTYKGKAGRGNTQLFSFFIHFFVKKFDRKLSNFQILCTFSEKFTGNARRFSRIFKIFQNFPAGARDFYKKKERNLSVSLYLWAESGAHVAALLALAGDLNVNLGDLAALNERLEQGRNGRGLDIQASQLDEHGRGLGLAVDNSEQGVADGLLLSLLLSGLFGDCGLAQLVGVIQLADGLGSEGADLVGQGLVHGDGVVEFTVGHSSFLSGYLVATH